jgi:uncharacterized protein YdaU (DUF1376 family)
MKKTPYVRFFWSDWIADTSHLDLMQLGAYMRLLEFVYQHGRPLPGDMEKVYRICHAMSASEQAAIKTVLHEYFKPFDDPEHGLLFRHFRAEREMEWAETAQTAKIDRGIKGAAGKWGGEAQEKDLRPTRSQRLSEARKKGTHTAVEWVTLVDICGARCVMCGTPGVERLGGIFLVKDHILPIFLGGSDGIDNIQPLCSKCNSSKGPNTKDLRPDGWKKRLLERLLNQASDACLDACLTPAIQIHSHAEGGEPPKPPVADPPADARPRRGKRQQDPFVLPADVDPDAWSLFDRHRGSVKPRDWTPDTMRLNAKVLSGQPPQDQVAIVEKSVRSGWAGLFPLNQPAPGGNGNGSHHESRGDRTARVGSKLYEEFERACRNGAE